VSIKSTKKKKKQSSDWDFEALAIQYEILRGERANTEARELQIITTVLSCLLVILPLGLELGIGEVFLIFPMVSTIGYAGTIWFRISYIVRNETMKNVQEMMINHGLVNVFDFEDRVQEKMRSKVEAVYIKPILSLSFLITVVGLYFGYSSIMTKLPVPLYILIPCTAFYVILVAFSFYLKDQPLRALSEVDHLKQLLLPSKKSSKTAGP